MIKMAKKKTTKKKTVKKSASSSKAEAKSDVFFVGVKDPIEIRRSLLESSKEMVQLLQRYEKFKQVRAEKISNIERLKSDMKKLKQLVSQLKRALPKTDLRIKATASVPEMVQKPVVVNTTQKVEKSKSKPKVVVKKATEVERLEDELDMIERRLSNLI